MGIHTNILVYQETLISKWLMQNRQAVLPEDIFTAALFTEKQALWQKINLHTTIKKLLKSRAFLFQFNYTYGVSSQAK